VPRFLGVLALLGLSIQASAKEDSDFLIIEQADTSGRPANADVRLMVKIHRKDAVGGTVEVTSPQGFSGTWDGRPGVSASFGRLPEGNVQVHYVSAVGEVTETIRIQNKSDVEGRRSTCSVTVQSTKKGINVKSKCLSDGPPIQISEANCSMPASTPLQTYTTRIGCMAFLYTKASDIAMESQALMADALGLRSTYDTIEQRYHNLEGTEDLLENQALRAAALRDETVMNAIIGALDDRDSADEALREAITLAQARRQEARKYVNQASGEIAELVGYFTGFIIEAVMKPALLQTLIAEGLNIGYIKNFVVPFTKTLKASASAYRAADDRLEAAIASLLEGRNAENAAQAKVMNRAAKDKVAVTYVTFSDSDADPM